MFVLASLCPTDPLILPHRLQTSVFSEEHAGTRALFPQLYQWSDVIQESQISRYFKFPVAVVNYPAGTFMFLEELPPSFGVPAMLL